jgi:hypothetical protein
MSFVLQIGEGSTIDLRQVESVGPVFGDPAWRRYIVRFRSGACLEIYESRRDETACMARADFVAKWLNSLQP